MQQVGISDSTTLSYWLNWRVLLCAVWVFTPMIVSLFIIWKYERSDHSTAYRGKSQPERANSLHYGDDVAWRPCLGQIHPIWLLAYRVIAFCLLLVSLIDKIRISGFVMFYYYTQWAFTLVTVYFAFGSLLSIYGCYQYLKMGSTIPRADQIGIDAEQGYYIPLANGERTHTLGIRKCSKPHEEIHVPRAACIASHLFQILYQMNAGAVMFTDCVYWSIIFPFLTIKDYDLNLLTINMHSLNVVLLLGDTALNCLPFPWFRFAYFILWTGVFVIFQWIVHACKSFWWPYAFLDLSSPYAPLWYLLMALMHIPCYGFFVLVVKLKHDLLSKWFLQS